MQTMWLSCGSPGVLIVAYHVTLKRYLACMGSFYRYSVGNALRIWSQKSKAAQVAGFQKWMNLGRKVKQGLAEAEEFSVLVHEWAHEILHHYKGVENISKTILETEAGAVSYVVCKAVGLDTSTASSDYIQLYNGKKETLMESLERIREVSGRLLRFFPSY